MICYNYIGSDNMKFCPECGSFLNNHGECDSCGYNKKDYVKLESQNFIYEPNFHIPKVISLDELKNMEVENGKLLSISIYDDGGMLAGYSHNVTVDFDSKTISKEDRNGYDNPYTLYYYSISDDELSNIKKMIDEYNLPAWSKLELSPTYMAQDNQRRIFFSYEKSNKTINRLNIYPFSVMNQEERKIYNDFISEIYSYIKEDNLIDKKEEINILPPQGNPKYCPECGKVLESDTCECGFTLKK